MKLLDKIEHRLRMFVYEELFTLLDKSLKIEITNYLSEYDYYKKIIEQWYFKKCEREGYKRFDGDVSLAIHEATKIDSGYWGLRISLTNPDEYVEEYGEYSNCNSIYHIHREDILYVLMHYKEEVEEIKKYIDNYFEELDDVDKN